MEQTSGSGAGLPLLIAKQVGLHLLILWLSDYLIIWHLSSNEEENWSGQVRAISVVVLIEYNPNISTIHLLPHFSTLFGIT